MNRFEFTCTYCGEVWGANYGPQELIFCPKCRDGNVRVRKISEVRVDYYAGSPPFKDDPEEWGF